MELKDMKELIKYFDKSDLTELEIEDGDTRLYVSKNPSMPQMHYTPVPQVHHAAAPQIQSSAMPVAAIAPTTEPKPATEANNGKTIDSPIIGTYYSAGSPGAAPFVKVGDVVDKGQTLCIIEAMKIMNTIEAEYRCKILEMRIENGKPVEFGQAIFVVEPQ